MITKDDLTLTHLGKQSVIETDPNKVVLDRIPNPQSAIYVSRFTIPEFTSKCPKTGQPDFATLIIDYVPKQWLLESKALKLWMFAFRDHGAFHEDVTVGIGRRFYETVEPYWVRIAGFWYARGGISIDITWECGKLPLDAHPLSLDVKPISGRHA